MGEDTKGTKKPEGIKNLSSLRFAVALRALYTLKRQPQETKYQLEV